MVFEIGDPVEVSHELEEVHLGRLRLPRRARYLIPGLSCATDRERPKGLVSTRVIKTSPSYRPISAAKSEIGPMARCPPSRRASAPPQSCHGTQDGISLGGTWMAPPSCYRSAAALVPFHRICAGAFPIMEWLPAFNDRCTREDVLAQLRALR